MRYWHKIILYLKLPEMRLFWFFLPFFLIFAIVALVKLSGWVAVVSIIALLGMMAVIIMNNLRLARSNLDIQVEKNELKSIIANLRDGIVAYDPNFKIVVFNRAAEEIFNIAAKEMIGSTFTLERAREPRFKLLAQTLFPSLAPLAVRQSEPGVYPQISDISFDDPKIELKVITDRIFDPAGRLLGFVKLIHDRTREVNLLKSKSEFIATASHQLRTPLSAIYWALESLAKESLGPSQKEIIDAGLKAAVKLLKTVNDLLDVSKIEEGQFGYQFENVNIIEFIEDVLKDAENLAKQLNIKLYFQKPTEPSIALYVDPQKLGMALSNLIHNAIRYNVENGEVVVSLKRLEGQSYWQISVKDTGVGIPPEEMVNLFTKFFRAANAAKIAPDGSGLGLYIAKNIIKRHGGEIWVESQLNRGSIFHFTLPTDPKLIPPKEIIWGEE